MQTFLLTRLSRFSRSDQEEEIRVHRCKSQQESVHGKFLAFHSLCMHFEYVLCSEGYALSANTHRIVCVLCAEEEEE